MNNIKKIIALLSAFILIFLSVIPVFAEEKTYKQGDIIEFGSYPQSLVSDKTLINKLNKSTKKWSSYEYNYDSSATKENYMQYSDVCVDGENYRAVKMSKYRTSSQEYLNSSFDNNDSGNTTFKIELNTVYWFKYEPILWQVLDPETGFVISKNIIDCQPFSISLTYDFANSDIRTWLNTTFKNTAFEKNNEEHILLSYLDNNADPIEYLSTPCSEKIFLISKNEAAYLTGNMSDEGIFEDYTAPEITDYALIQGALPEQGFLTRTPHYDGCITQINTGGHSDHTNIDFAGYGICPAMHINLETFNKTIQYGDIDNNGKLSAADARLTLRAAVGLETFSDELIKIADVNKNGRIESADARLILRAAVGLEDPSTW